MKKIFIALLCVVGLVSCSKDINSNKMTFLTEKIPNNIPLPFLEHLIPENQLIHKGIFSPDLQEYYYTLSDKNYQRFDVFVIRKEEGEWSKPKKAFFNSNFSEHGMSFSPNGNSIYFSSTRPTNTEGVSESWHIWKSDKIDGKWSTPTFVDILNLRDKLVSHPTVTNDGVLYFHVSNLDYSEMDIYRAKKKDGRFKNAEKAPITIDDEVGKCTPYVSANNDYLLFAAIGKQLDLMISYNDGNDNWINTHKLSNTINHLGQGNPYVTPDNKYLFFTVSDQKGENWKVKWVNFESELN